MRRHEKNLEEKQRPKFESYLSQNPVLEEIYKFKQIIYEFLSMIEKLKQTSLQPLQTLGETLYKWKEEIGRMMRFSLSNGITEGFHTKMEMLSRRAFGFRNFKNYRLRVIALCGWNGVFTLRN